MTEEPMGTPAVPSFEVTTEFFDSAHLLHDYLDENAPLLFQRQGLGVVGQGIAHQEAFTGANRIQDAATWWSNVVAQTTTRNEVGRPGTGLVAFGAFSFSGDSATPSSLTIPQLVIGRDAGGYWITRVGNADTVPFLRTDRDTPTAQVNWASPLETGERFLQAVGKALQEIQSGSLHKVVLAREILGTSQEPVSVYAAIRALSESYPDTHVFANGGFLGASPETLASVHGEQLSLRVLAGSTSRGSDPLADAEHSSDLATSTKDLDEHHYAVASVMDSLHSAGLAPLADDEPRTLKLKNLWHLATDIKAPIPRGTSVLSITAALHPTAAVAGTPTAEAVKMIGQLEGFDRGLFSGPIGWVDDRGNGEFAVALRCALLGRDRTTVTAHAGAGIIKDSVAASELLETELKFQPIRDALG